LQYWVTDLIDKDQLLMLNTMQILDALLKSWSFCSEFKKQRGAIDKLLALSKEPRLSASDRQLIFRVTQQISSTIDIETVKEYDKA